MSGKSQNDNTKEITFPLKLQNEINNRVTVVLALKSNNRPTKQDYILQALLEKVERDEKELKIRRD